MGITAILLAAGASRRLGQPKQLVRVAGEPLLACTLRIVREAGLTEILVVLGAQREQIIREIDLCGAGIVVNPDWEQGIAGSIQAGILAVTEAATPPEAVMLLVCDQPRLTAAHLQELIAAWQQAPEPSILASLYDGLAGIPAIFPASQFRRLLALKGDSGARALLRDPDVPVLAVPFEGGELDIDTPADLAILD